MLFLTHLLAAALLVAEAPASAPRAPSGTVASRRVVPRAVAPRPVARQDSADILYRAGRDAMSRGDYRQAAELFERVGARYPSSTQASNAFYWRAFSLYQSGSTSDLRRARTSLRTLRDSGKDAFRGDAAALDTRICGELARRGDAQCAATVEQRADSGSFGAIIGEAVRAATALASDAGRLGARAAADAMNDPEVRAALLEAANAAREGMRDGARAAADAMRSASGDLRDAARDASREASRRGRGRTSSECEGGDDDVKVVALNALMQMDAERAMPLLRKVMASRERCAEVLRRKAVFLIAQKRVAESTELLVDAARNDPDEDVRKESLFWLGRVDGARAQEILRDVALKSGDVDLQKQAVFSLSQSGSASGRETLRQIAASNDANPDVRAEAIFWLGQRGSAEDTEYLRTLYGRLTNRDLKDKVLFAVSRRRGNASWLLDLAQDTRESTELRKQALFYAGQGGANVEQLVALYDRATDQEMKKQLVFVYQQRGSGPAFEKLLDIARAEKDVEIRKDALFWVARSKDPRALKLIEEIIK